MQTCALCNAASPDRASQCGNCQADLTQYSTTALALQRFRANPNVTAVTVASGFDTCSHCFEQLGTYPVDKAPRLPHLGCSGPNGCQCFYIPILNTIHP